MKNLYGTHRKMAGLKTRHRHTTHKFFLLPDLHEWVVSLQFLVDPCLYYFNLEKLKPQYNVFTLNVDTFIMLIIVQITLRYKV